MPADAFTTFFISRVGAWSMDQVVKSYCLECDWAARDDQVADRTAAMIEHAVATGHDIESMQLTLALEPPPSPQLN